MRKFIVVLLLLILTLSSVLMLLPISVAAKTIVVPYDYATIQEAVDSANYGDIISVKAGRYLENVVVDKTIQIIGESPSTTTVFGDYISAEDKDTFVISANFVIIANLTISNDGFDGIDLFGSGCEIRNNIFSTGLAAVRAIDCSDLKIMGNVGGFMFLEEVTGGTMSENTMSIEMRSSSNIVVSNNSIGNCVLRVGRNCLFQNNTFGDIEVYGSSHCSFLDNTAETSRFSIISSTGTQLKRNSFGNFKVTGDDLADFTHDIDTSNTIKGKPIQYLVDQNNIELNPETCPNIGSLYIVNSTKIRISKLNLSTCGINLISTTNSEIIENNLSNQEITIQYESNQNFISMNNLDGVEAGISVTQSSSNNIERNVFNQTALAIGLRYAFDNKIVGNTMKTTTLFNMRNAENNTIYHNNFIDYNFTIFDPHGTAEPTNTWTDSYPGGGNYWKYTGIDEKHGPAQSQLGPDGIIDSAKQGSDIYPLAAPVQFLNSSWRGKTIMVEFITNSTVSNLTIDDANKSVSFTAEGAENTTGFSRITLSNSLVQNNWNSEYAIMVNGQEVAFTTQSDSTNTYNYVTFQNQPEDQSQPEATNLFSEAVVIVLAIALIIMVAAFAVIVLKRSKNKTLQT